MHLFVTGGNGYIGKRLIRALLDQGHVVTTSVRDRQRFALDAYGDVLDRLYVIEADFLDDSSLVDLPNEVDAAYYLIHSMGSGHGFTERESSCAIHFVRQARERKWKRIVYLGGLVSHEQPLSEHLASRSRVEHILGESGIAFTSLRASIIVGSGSASFEIVRDLAEKLPVLVTPRWVHTKCQPIAIRNVLDYLTGVVAIAATENHSYDIGGPEIMSYLELIKGYSEVRGLKRYFFPTRILSPRLSSAWLCLLTSTPFPLARALVDSLTHETICHDQAIRDVISTELLTYREAVSLALARIAQNHVPSSWIDSITAGTLSPRLFDAVKVPEHGVSCDSQIVPLVGSRHDVIEKIWSIGGRNGWPSMNWAWIFRGQIDKLFGGIGIRRGRRHPRDLKAGDALDFWRVLLADEQKGRLILYAEMKLPGEAWLEFSIEEIRKGQWGLRQTATFRPQGLLGRLYWWMVLPFHIWLFPRMARRLAAG